MTDESNEVIPNDLNISIENIGEGETLCYVNCKPGDRVHFSLDNNVSSSRLLIFEGSSPFNLPIELTPGVETEPIPIREGASGDYLFRLQGDESNFHMIRVDGAGSESWKFHMKFSLRSTAQESFSSSLLVYFGNNAAVVQARRQLTIENQTRSSKLILIDSQTRILLAESGQASSSVDFPFPWQDSNLDVQFGILESGGTDYVQILVEDPPPLPDDDELLKA